MSDDIPSPAKGVYIYLDYIALGFVLVAVEEIFRPGSTWKVAALCFALGAVFLFFGVMGQRIKTALVKHWPRRKKLATALAQNATLGRELEQAKQQVGELTIQLQDEVKRSDGYVAQIASWQQSEQETADRLQGKLTLANTELYTLRAQNTEREKRRRLEFRYDRPIARVISSDNLRDSYVLIVGNIQKMVPIVSEYATARIRFSNEADSNHFTVTRAMWAYRHEDERHVTTGLHPWVHIKGAEEQAFVLLFKHLDGTLWAHEATESVPVGWCSTGRWTMEVSVVCDDAEPLVSVVQLKVYPDGQYKWSDLGGAAL